MRPRLIIGPVVLLRSQGTLEITDLDADPEHRDCATDGLNQWGGLPVTLVAGSSAGSSL